MSQAGPHNSSIPVLVVDDEPDLLDVMRFVLESEGFGVETARNGKEALERLVAGWSPGLVLLDLMIPGYDGFEVCKRLREDPTTRSIPIVIISALDDQESRTRAEYAGATIIMINHDEGLADQLPRQIRVLDGQIISDRTKADAS